MKPFVLAILCTFLVVTIPAALFLGPKHTSLVVQKTVEPRPTPRAASIAPIVPAEVPRHDPSERLVSRTLPDIPVPVAPEVAPGPDPLKALLPRLYEKMNESSWTIDERAFQRPRCDANGKCPYCGVPVHIPDEYRNSKARFTKLGQCEACGRRGMIHYFFTGRDPMLVERP